MNNLPGSVRPARSVVHQRDAVRTRERILSVAQSLFARHGYDGTSVRAVAAAADVAPNLVTRYFGGKPGLFRAATTIDLGADDALPGPYSHLGERIAERVVARWDAVEQNDPLLMMIRSAGSSDAAAAALARFFSEQATGPLARHVAGQIGCSVRDAEDRAAGVGSLILGVVTARYVMRKGPLAVAGRASLQRWLAVMLQRILDDPAPPRLSAVGGSPGRVRKNR